MPLDALNLPESPEVQAEWDRYGQDADLSISYAADELTEAAREVARTRRIPFTLALAMVYQTVVQRIEWGEVDPETGDDAD